MVVAAAPANGDVEAAAVKVGDGVAVAAAPDDGEAAVAAGGVASVDGDVAVAAV